mgnify:CR=1 FL=1
MSLSEADASRHRSGTMEEVEALENVVVWLLHLLLPLLLLVQKTPPLP